MLSLFIIFDVNNPCNIDCRSSGNTIIKPDADGKVDCVTVSQ